MGSRVGLGPICATKAVIIAGMEIISNKQNTRRDEPWLAFKFEFDLCSYC